MPGPLDPKYYSYETLQADVSIWIKSAVLIAGFGLNVEHRTPNIEFRILKTLRFIVFKLTYHVNLCCQSFTIDQAGRFSRRR